jgi:hypothetical protein
MILRRFSRSVREQNVTAIVNVVNDKCGDRPSRIRDHKTIESTLRYPCRIGLPQANLDPESPVLRAHRLSDRRLRPRILDNTLSVASDDVVKNRGKLAGNDQ